MRSCSATATVRAKNKRRCGEFVTLFSTHAGYDALGARIAKTLGKSAERLAVSHWEVPLHNNESEFGARISARAGGT
jgi:hypothetical protein